MNVLVEADEGLACLCGDVVSDEATADYVIADWVSPDVGVAAVTDHDRGASHRRS